MSLTTKMGSFADRPLCWNKQPKADRPVTAQFHPVWNAPLPGHSTGEQLIRKAVIRLSRQPRQIRQRRVLKSSDIFFGEARCCLGQRHGEKSFACRQPAFDPAKAKDRRSPLNFFALTPRNIEFGW